MNACRITDTVGKTPLVRLDRMFPLSHITVLAKLEYLNPSLSIKDRIVRHIVDEAEMSGALRPGGTIVENTSGNTGAAIAMIAAARGYKAILTMPDKVSEEKRSVLRAFGAEIVICPTSVSPDSDNHYVRKARAIAAQIPDSFMINQYDNAKNAEAHYLTTGPEIWEQMGDAIDYFVASGSTGGTVSGTGRFLKEKKPSVKVVMPDPYGSIYYTYFKTGAIDESEVASYEIEGVGEDHLAKCMDFSLVDEMYQFTDDDAFHVALRAAREEGLFVGPSAGANLWGCMKLAETLTEPTTIVTILPDSGLKYLSKYKRFIDVDRSGAGPRVSYGPLQGEEAPLPAV
jgi:cystathionine beta-synthase/cysteine synthase A